MHSFNVLVNCILFAVHKIHESGGQGEGVRESLWLSKSAVSYLFSGQSQNTVVLFI